MTDYYEADGRETLEPTIDIIEYAVCTIHPFDNTVIADAFGIDMSAEYPQFNLTYGEVIQNMANALKMTLYGTLGNGTAVPLTDAELIAFVNRQNCNATRKHILTTALSLVGKTIRKSAEQHAKDILDQLRELKVDLRSNPAVFIGGGSALFRDYLEHSPLVASARMT